MEFYDDYGAPRTDLPDGVYLDMPEEVYFAQPRLGSTDIKTLHEQRYGWWWQSRFNPHRVREDTAATSFGKALHKLLLEGITAYRDTYVVLPDFDNFNGVRVMYKIDEYKEELASRGIVPKPAPKGAQEWLDLCRTHVPPVTAVAYKNVMDDFQAAYGDKPRVTANDDRNLNIMYELIAQDDTQAGDDLRQILSIDTTYPTLAELTFLWTDGFGVQRRSRFDKFLPNFTLDLKSLSNWRGAPLDFGISEHIIRNGYDLQLADYHLARILLHKMVQDLGDAAIYGGTTEQRAWLHAICIKNMPFDWVWLFYQIPDAKAGRAPIVFPLREHWQGPYHISGHRKAYKAMETYIAGLRRFGLNNPWGEIRPLHHTKEGTSTSIFLSAWGWDTGGAVLNEDILDRV